MDQKPEPQPKPLGVCCRIQFCCPPGKAARALAEHLAGGGPNGPTGADSYEAIASRVLAEFALVPRTLEALPGAPHPQAGAETLARLHVYLRNELRQILVALGHEVEEGS